MGHHRLPRLYPRADPDRARRGRSIRHGAAAGGGAGGMLLPGGNRAATEGQARAAPRGGDADAAGDFRVHQQAATRPSRGPNPAAGHGCRRLNYSAYLGRGTAQPLAAFVLQYSALGKVEGYGAGRAETGQWQWADRLSARSGALPPLEA